MLSFRNYFIHVTCGVHSFLTQMRGKLHQVHLLFYCVDLLACWGSFPYFQKQQVVNKCQFSPKEVALTSKKPTSIFWWSPSTKDKDTPTSGGDCKWQNLNCRAPAALQHWLLALWGNQPGRAVEGESLKVTPDHFASIAMLIVYRIGNYGQCQTLHLVCCTYWHWWNSITWHPHHQTHSFLWRNEWENIANWDTGAPYGRLYTWYKQLFDVYIKYFFKNKQDHSFTKSNSLNLK